MTKEEWITYLQDFASSQEWNGNEDITAWDVYMKIQEEIAASPAAVPALAYSDFKIACLTEKEFEELAEYSHSIPTGTITGKRWKVNRGGIWWLGKYYDLKDDPANVGIEWKRIEVIKVVPAMPQDELVKALDDLIYTAQKLWDETDKPIMSGGAFTVTHPIIETAKEVLSRAKSARGQSL